MKFEGIYTPAVTPFASNGEIDRDEFANVLEHLIAAGVHGIIVGGSTGEYYAQMPSLLWRTTGSAVVGAAL